MFSGERRIGRAIDPHFDSAHRCAHQIGRIGRHTTRTNRDAAGFRGAVQRTNPLASNLKEIFDGAVLQWGTGRKNHPRPSQQVATFAEEQHVEHRRHRRKHGGAGGLERIEHVLEHEPAHGKYGGAADQRNHQSHAVGIGMAHRRDHENRVVAVNAGDVDIVDGFSNGTEARTGGHLGQASAPEVGCSGTAGNVGKPAQKSASFASIDVCTQRNQLSSTVAAVTNGG